jgi:hypothetical protein
LFCRSVAGPIAQSSLERQAIHCRDRRLAIPANETMPNSIINRVAGSGTSICEKDWSMNEMLGDGAPAAAMMPMSFWT